MNESGSELDTNQATLISGVPRQVQIVLQSARDRIQAAYEEVSVPQGANITVRRSRTVEHAIEVNWQATAGISVSVGVRDILSASIRSELERQHGHTFRESETREYSVELNGDRATRYRLVWTDVWREGTLGFQERGSMRLIPFRLRESTELLVQPV